MDYIEREIDRHFNIMLRNADTNTNKSWARGVNRQRRSGQTGSDSSFLQVPSVYQLERASIMLPIAWRLTFGIAIDAIKDFDLTSVIDIDNEKISKRLEDINFKKEWQKRVGYARATGHSITILQEEGVQDLNQPLGPGKIIGIKSYPESGYDRSPINLFGNVEYYDITSENGVAVRVHPTRVLECNTFLNGEGVLIPCWSEIIVAMTIMEATGHAAFRHGVGQIALIGSDETSDEVLEEVSNDIKSNPPTMGSWYLLPSGVEKAFTLSPKMIDLPSLMKMTIDNICASSGYSRPILMGEVAGVQTGSEVNERSYYSLIENVQWTHESDIRKLLYLLDLDLPESFKFKWKVHFAETKEKKLQNEKMQTDILNAMQGFATPEEIRKKAFEFFPEVIDENKKIIKPKITSTSLSVDRGDLVKLKNSMSNIEGVNQFCKDNNMSNSTFYKVKEAVKKYDSKNR